MKVDLAVYAALLSSFPGVLTAQEFVWQGQVDGIAVLHIRGNRLEVERREGGPVSKQRYHFYHPLPDSRGNVELEVKEGRGSVRVTDQPTIENDYTASVTIEDRQPGPGVYSIALRWATDRGSFESDPKPWTTRDSIDRLTWAGRVQGEVMVLCRASACRSEALTGDPVYKEKYKFTRPLPERESRVTLDDTSGRGDIRVVEQPTRANNYTVRVQIRDNQSGAADYSFVLSWLRPTPVPKR